MIFRRIILYALLVGFLAGALLSAAQILTVNPIIFEAETFEVQAEFSHVILEHSDEAWSPEDGFERTLYTLLANIFAGIGFSVVILALMSQLQTQGITQLNLFKGLLWGAAGFTVFFLAPGLGLPPEIPGIDAAPLENRQLWWLLAVVSVGIGLLVLAFASLKYKLLGILALALPYCVTIPHHEGPAFNNPDPQAITTLMTLHQEFILASGFSNLLFWLALGAISAWVLNRWVLKGVEAVTSAQT